MGAKTDFAAMSDDNLCRWIAQRRGWTDVHQAQDGMWWGLPPGGRSMYLPDWTGDLNAAWELFVELPRGVLYRCNERAGVEYMIDYLTLRSITAAQPARAIAEAWARWKEQDHDD